MKKINPAGIKPFEGTDLHPGHESWVPIANHTSFVGLMIFLVLAALFVTTMAFHPSQGDLRSLLLFFGEPYAPYMIRLFARRNAYMLVFIYCFAIGIAASMGDPHSRTGTHHRFQRRDQPAGRMHDFDPAIRPALMDVGFTVCEDDDLFALQVPVESLLQPCRSQLSGSIFLLAGHSPEQLTHIAEDRLELPALFSTAPQEPSQFKTPVRARPFDRQERNAECRDCEDSEDHNQKCPRSVLSPIDIGQILNQNSKSKLLSLPKDWHCTHLNPARRQRRNRIPFMELWLRIPWGSVPVANPGPDFEAIELRRKGRSCRSCLEVGITGSHSHNALVARNR